MQNGENQSLFLITFYGFLTLTFNFYEKVLTLLKLDGGGPRVSARMEPALGERGRASVSCPVLGRTFPMTQKIAFPVWPPPSATPGTGQVLGHGLTSAVLPGTVPRVLLPRGCSKALEGSALVTVRSVLVTACVCEVCTNL